MIKEIAKIFFVAIFIVTISACEQQNCKNVACPAGEGCRNGKCYCPDGYEGTDCQTLANLKYVQPYYYDVTVNCFGSTPPFGTSGYTASMYADSDPRLVHITGLLGGVCSDVIATIRTDGSNQGNILEINYQNASCGGISVSGNGTWYPQSNSIVFNLDITSGGTYSCQHTFYRRQ